MKIPWRRKWQPTPVFLPGKSCGQRDLAGYTAWGGKESDSDLPTKQQRPGLPLRIWQRLKAKPTMNRIAPYTTEWFNPECPYCQGLKTLVCALPSCLSYLRHFIPALSLPPSGTPRLLYPAPLPHPILSDLCLTCEQQHQDEGKKVYIGGQEVGHMQGEHLL